MRKRHLLGQTTLPGNTDCRVLYDQLKDTVEIEVGRTSLKFHADSFIVIHEMLRKAAAKVVMQTEMPSIS